MQQNEPCKDRTKKFFDKVRTFFIRAFDGVQHFIENNIEPAIQFTKALKAAVDSGAADIVTALIPGQWDDAVVAFLKANLGKVIDLLQVQLVCSSEASVEDKIACYLDYLRTCSPDMRDALYAKTASLLTKLSSDRHQFTDAEIDAMVQLTYTQLKHD